MKVYVVETGSGSYDDAASWVHGIYLTPEEAINSLLELRAKIKEAKATPCPVDEDKDELTEQEAKAWNDWYFSCEWAREMWNGKIYVYPVGVAIGNDHRQLEQINPDL